MIKFIKNISIKTKLGILFFILLISISILGYKTIYISKDNQIILRDVHSKSQAVLSLQNNIITPLYNLRQLSHSLVMAPNQDIRKNIQLEIDEIIKHLNANFNDVKRYNYEIYEIWNNYKNLFYQTKEYLDDEFEEGAYINITTVAKKQFDILMDRLLNLQRKSLNNSTIAYNDAVTKTKEIKFEIIISIMLILIFSVFINWLISNNIISSISSVQNGLNDFFKYLNDKKTQVNKIELSCNDEFKQMATIINKNILYISNNIEQNEALIKNATKILENLKSGNLGTRLYENTNDKSLNELKNMINDMIDNLEKRINKEIKQRLAQEQLLVQQSKLAAMGEMIGNIAHQWRQPLAEISAIHMNMKVTYDFNKFDKKYLNEKIKEANKLTAYMSQTITDFQNFFKPRGEKEIFSVQNACKEAAKIIESSLRYHEISLKFNTIKDTNILGYKNEYSQVILNILSNAKDIIIERKIKFPRINIEIKEGNNYSIVKISDNAGGIAEKILDKIFEPYFTTRYKTQGTGIGLYMSKNIIERNMYGFINVKNTDEGALFTIKVLKIEPKSTHKA
ncbi:sensor histidine kinase [Campylobacter hyointestinalis]|uniref:histidine kinase n=1 Tax=Campylobacter hyointestinalis subsp. hyointestinalis TaxID=91352 RepID=A0A0S4SKP5_CAMHY|nr:HAMP domain-containing sensor histidine kinase [Campylobacter hyointestinalis]MBT0612645.1 HAMP domain-containing histidine kinase [Campylobacter hyointestinalis subsp. hyointestinalis]MDY2999167.1 ATP-binding protein [Campylobacter hyointestinalis]PPB52281.1 histidine kinase [Campylobacter hyointestinalis subsp. hyointestinalis]PPB52652.1 histidine kinase [Campylobacter hyointestinalis subsp. hyointestinalis]PPB56069.1 histidine kinase [Campylobacter hyointestinalis subsp. hyointestinalis]